MSTPYTLAPGRCILRDDLPLATLHRVYAPGGHLTGAYTTTPAEMDALGHSVVEALNMRAAAITLTGFRLQSAAHVAAARFRMVQEQEFNGGSGRKANHAKHLADTLDTLANTPELADALADFLNGVNPKI